MIFALRSAARLAVMGGVLTLAACARGPAPQFAPAPDAPPAIDLVPTAPRQRPQIVSRTVAPQTGADTVLAAYQRAISLAERDLADAIAAEEAARAKLEQHRAVRPTAPAALMTGPALQQAFAAEQQWQQTLHTLELAATERHATSTLAKARLDQLVQTPPAAGRDLRDGKPWQDQRGRDPLHRTTPAPAPRPPALD